MTCSILHFLFFFLSTSFQYLVIEAFLTPPRTLQRRQHQHHQDTSLLQHTLDLPEDVAEYDITCSAAALDRNTRNTHILILPGFGACYADYTTDGSLVPNLQQKGFEENQIHVLPIERHDWSQIMFKGMTDSEFWKGNAEPNRPAYCWYLQRVAQEMQRIVEEDTNAQIILCGHSAGGWLARAAVGYGTAVSTFEDLDEGMCGCGIEIDIDRVAGIVTLGSPHLLSGFDATGGALGHVNNKFPGAYFKEHFFYLTVAGCGVEGKNDNHSSLEENLAHNFYKLASGAGEKAGDGITPVDIAHLSGAVQINIDDAVHAHQLGEAWYGSAQIIDSWLRPTLNLLAASAAR